MTSLNPVLTSANPDSRRPLQAPYWGGMGWVRRTRRGHRMLLAAGRHSQAPEPRACARIRTSFPAACGHAGGDCIALSCEAQTP